MRPGLLSVGGAANFISRAVMVMPALNEAPCVAGPVADWRGRGAGLVRAFRRVAFERLALADRGFGWNVEMQVRAVEHGLRIAEAPVCFHPRVAGESKISGHLRGIVRAGWGIVSTVGNLYVGRAGIRPGKRHTIRECAADAIRQESAETSSPEISDGLA